MTATAETSGEVAPADGATFDVVIAGAGPTGLSLAVAAADVGLTAAVVERQSRAELAAPPPDGREIALTHRARDILRALGLWQRFAEDEIAPLRKAAVTDGRSPFTLGFDADRHGREQLGFLVGNEVIRRAAFAEASTREAITIVDGVAVTGVATSAASGTLTLADGRRLHGRLVVAADNRFSENRRRMGIGAQMLDFGRIVIVCRLRHERPHHGIAHECFGYGGTLAILPLNGDLVSAVVTVPADAAPGLLAMEPARFADYVRERFGNRLGAMSVLGERHTYPLVAVYAHRFVAQRFALIGDAAVGMHPVTAHGFNFGLYGVDALARAWQRERRKTVGTAGAPPSANWSGRLTRQPATLDPGSDAALSAYQSEHRRTTFPIYTGTNAIVRLFTDDSPPARVARAAALRVANLVTPIKRQITLQLTGTGTQPAA